MEKPNYKVNIKDIYIGDVRMLDKDRNRIILCKNGIYRYDFYDEEDEMLLKLRGKGFLLNKKENQLMFDEGCGLFQSEKTFLRTMLFTLDENNHANDLLYDSPHYPIFNISPNEDCLDSPIALTNNVYNLYNFLRFMKYTEGELEYKDIQKIREKYFNCDFIIDNHKLFGIEDVDTNISLDETVTDSSGKLHIMEFANVEWESFERYLFKMILISKDYFSHSETATFKSGYQFEGKVIDVFKPCEEEGPIKSLGSLF